MHGTPKLMLERFIFRTCRYYRSQLNFQNGSCRVFFDNSDMEKRYSHLFQILANTKAFSEGQTLHSHIIKIQPKPQIFVSNSLANFYFKCGFVDDAQQVFDEMCQPDVVSWNTMIGGYLLCGYLWNSFFCFKMMLACGFVPDRFSFISVLKCCVSYGDIAGGSQVHGLLIKFHLGDNVFVGNGLLDLYAEFHCFDEALKVFDSLVFKDTTLINTMIGIYAKTGNLEEAFSNFRLILSASNVPTNVTFLHLLSAISGYGNLRQGLQVHGVIIKYGFEGQGVIENSLVGMYCSCGAMDEPFDLLFYLCSKNVMSWTTLISGYTIHGCFQEAMDVFSWIYRDVMVVIDEVLLASILNASAACGCLHLGTQIHSLIFKSGIESYKYIAAALMDMYAKCLRVEDMQKMFRQIDDKQNMLFWTTVISGNVHNGFPMKALESFSEMLKEGVKPDAIAYVSVLSGCVDLETIEQGELIHAYVTKSGSGSNISVQTALISLYAHCGCFCSAVKLFEKMEHDVVSFTALISGYSKFGYSEEAQFWLVKMLWEGIRPNRFTLASALTACAKSTTIETGKSLHNLIIRTGMEDDKFVASSLIDMYSKCGAIDDAVNFFNGTPKHDIVVWNSMLAGHAHHGNGTEVLKAFDEMQSLGMNPDGITFLSVLSGCSHGNLVDRVIRYFVSMRDEYGISPMMEHYAVVVDALGRAGLFNEAVKFVEGMDSEPWIVVLRSLLSCCILRGSTQLGLAVVAKIMESGEDDAATYVLFSKLYAIDGRWDDARKVREVMERKFWQPKVLDRDDFKPVAGEEKQNDESKRMGSYFSCGFGAGVVEYLCQVEPCSGGSLTSEVCD
ncbi:hypothetical protein HHK36_004528 [Tetracentron sinense]|uniref:Pentatricopeptide repeat-containing protein n=1 Tax=Tetracentron sinense TaxID=13715 RepID=A0A834ZV29_TETSI|nr:hypothetical protein HHK36_004528 [Tetracentron sinense]